MHAAVRYQIAAIGKHFVAVEIITFVLLNAVVNVFDMNIEVSSLVEGFSANLADFVLDLRVSALVRFEL